MSRGNKSWLVANKMYFGGVDGGASSSTAVLLDHSGEVLAQTKGPATQLWLVGVEESADRIIKMMEDLKTKCGLSVDTKLKSIGVSISGGNEKEINERFVDYMETKHAGKCENYVCKCDTYGPVATCSKSASGVVLIAGTGSMCQYFSGNRHSCRSGGWGHLIGDEGSGYWVAKKAIKAVINHQDNFKNSNNDVEPMRAKIMHYFDLEEFADILKPFYGDFKKSFIAGFCREVASLATENKDPLAIEIFRKAGQHLANHLVAMTSKILKLKNGTVGPLLVVCAGSLWESWSLLKGGFLETMAPKFQHDFVLVRMKVTSAYGAALFGAKASDVEIPADLRKNYQIIYSYEKDDDVKY